MTDTNADERRAVLMNALAALDKMQQELDDARRENREPIAIVGMACRFPGDTNSPDDFWRFIQDGGDAITKLPTERWDTEFYYDPDPEAAGKMYTRSGGFLKNVDLFDAHFFSISPREAVSMDPQQRLLLEVGWEALENAGYCPDQLASGRTGVYVGITLNDYGYLQKRGGTKHLNAYHMTGNHLNYAAGRIAYTFGLQGPTMAVDTACSSSLVSIHLGCLHLRANECDAALACGVNLILAPIEFIMASKARMLSPDGRCKTFDADADGFGRGEGCGVLLLKRLSDAQRDNDTIHAVIRGSAVNHDGASSGLTVPNMMAQQDLIRQALQNADLDPASVQYIEAHGTGTKLGDPIEVRALDGVFGKTRPAGHPLLIGSVKTNIGHLESASGVAGVIKVVMALKHGQIPAILNFSRPNPHIDWHKVCTTVPTALTPWPAVEGSRIAGVSSFGASGTNAHVVLEAASPQPVADSPTERPLHLLALSAQSPEALTSLQHAYCGLMQKDPGISIADACFTANSGRKHFAYRQAFTAADTEEMLRAMTASHQADSGTGEDEAVHAGNLEPGIVFLFTGQGSQYTGMGRRLYETEPTFRKIMDDCDELFREQLGQSLLAIFAPVSADADAGSRLLNQTGFTQPALFALEYALCMLWRSWGIEPTAVMGHSVGEYVAACVAGVFDVQDGLKLISSRARLMQALPHGGAMTAVLADERKVTQVLAQVDAAVNIAAINGPLNTVISGPQRDVIAASAAFSTAKIRTVPLNVSHAFHSVLMEPMLAEFGRVASELSYRTPNITLISNVTGQPFTADESADGTYWSRHVRQPVRFFDSMQTLYQLGYRTFVEIGPHPVLLGMGVQCLSDEPLRWLPSLRRGSDDWHEMLSSLGSLYRAGAEVDWTGFDRNYTRHRIPLPTYPFQKKRYWMRSPAVETDQNPIAQPLLIGGIQSPLLPKIIFESRLSIEKFTYLKDHRITDRVIVPATLYMNLVAAGAQQIFDGKFVELKDIVFHQALILEKGQVCRLQLLFDHPQNASSNFKLICPNGDEHGREPSWVPVASGSVAAGAQDPALGPSADTAPQAINARCSRQIAGKDFYEQLQRYGYQFGDTFKGIQQVRFDGREAIGRIEPAEGAGVEDEPYIFQPALLDACLQVCAVFWLEESHTDAYIPVSAQGIRFYRRPSGPLWSYVLLDEIPQVGSEIRTGHITIFDESANVVAEIADLVVKRITGDMLHDAGRREIYKWLYRIDWKPILTAEDAAPGQPADFLPDLKQLAQTASDPIAGLDRELNFSSFAGLFPELDCLCREFILTALTKLGWQPVSGQAIHTHELAETLGIAPQHRRLWERFLEILCEDNVIQASSAGWMIADFPLDVDPEAHLRELLTQFPLGEAEITLIGHIGRNLDKALSGSKDPLSLMFPDGSTQMAEKLYRDSPYLIFYNRMIRQIVADAQSRLPVQRRLSVLEIGAGTGGTTSHVLPCLDARRTRYIFTDVSNLFLAKARKKFSDYPFVQYKLLNIEVDPEFQDFTPHSFDLIIAANVLHATADLRSTLLRVRRLLAPQGVLVLLEGSRRQRFADMIVGLTEGWWKFSDTDLRPSYPLISAKQWKELLLSCGFAEAALVSGGAIDAELFASQAVILAKNTTTLSASSPLERPDDTSKTRWVIFADHLGLGQKVAERLEADGQQTHLVYATEAPSAEDSPRPPLVVDPASKADFKQLWANFAADPLPIQGVIYLWGLDARIAPDAGVESLEASIEPVIAGALHLIQTLAETEKHALAKLWLITRAGQAMLNDPAPVVLPQSPLWGFGRTAMLEHPEMQCALLDLPAGTHGQAIDVILKEIKVGDGEQQVAWRDGTRYAARLTAAAKPAPEGTSTEKRLENKTPGMLDGLEWVPDQRPIPGPGQVAVRIRATGLNFRDVLMAMGLYPGESSPLGIECAGTIEAVGPGVAHFQVGDDVIAITPGSFSTIALADQHLVIKKSVEMRFEEAAAIPSIYLTAHFALTELAKLRSGERVLIHAAAGGVGWAALQVAIQAGAEIYATAGSDVKRQFLHAHGVRHVFDSRSLTFAEQVMEATDNAGVHVVLNSLTGEFIPKSLSVLGSDGRFVEIGRRDIWSDEQVRAFRADIRYFTINLLEMCLTDAARVRKMLASVVGLFREKAYRLPPIETFAFKDAPTAFRHMAQAKHIGKIVISQPDNCLATAAPAVREDGSYLITGGLTGLGLLVAQWLARQGAGHLVLMGRHQPVGENLTAIRKLETTDTRVRVVQGDVSQWRDVHRVLEEIASDRPLKGIFHCAGALSDGVLVKQTWQRFADVMAAKVSGSWNLHRISSDLQLDYFVMFSSAVSVLGSSGQANHAAACAFEDALAAYRRYLRLPAVSINWGPWSHIGAAASRQVGTRWQAQGIFSIPPSKGLQALEEVLSHPTQQIAVLNAVWSDFIKQQPGDKPPAFLSELVLPAAKAARQSTTEARQAPALLSQLQDAVGPERSKIIWQFVLTVVRRVLELEPDFAITPEQGLSDLGMDSLLSIELKNHLQQGSGLSLPATLAFDYPTPGALVELIGRKLQETGTIPETRDHTSAAPDAKEHRDIDKLSDDEAEAMLLQELDIEKKPNL